MRERIRCGHVEDYIVSLLERFKPATASTRYSEVELRAAARDLRERPLARGNRGRDLGR